jgi:acyl-CoA thioesterase YciA
MTDRLPDDPCGSPAGGHTLEPQGQPEDHQLALRVTPMPADVNANGDIFGGWVMAQVDVAGGVTAARRARGRVVTVAVNAFQFKQPVSVGDLVSFYTRVVATGRTSITVHVEVLAERNPAEPVTVKVTEATLTYVAIDTQGRKREVPPA